MFGINRGPLSLWYTFNKMKILIHPEALVHSIVEFDNYVTQFNLFQNDTYSNFKFFQSKNKI